MRPTEVGIARIRREAVVAQLVILFGHFPGGTGENKEAVIQDSRSPGRDLNSRVPEYDTGMLTTQPRRSVGC
jgi:hypothetical protein